MTDVTELIADFLQDAQVAIARDSLEKAKVLYQGILGIDGTNIEALSQLAAIAFNEGELHKALSIYSIAIEHHSGEADIHHGLAVIYRELGDEVKAIQMIDTALRIEPGHEPALFEKARMLQKRGNLNEAERLYLQLTAKNGSRLDAIFNRGVILFRQGNLKAAERWFRQAVKLDSGSPHALTNLALIYRYQGLFDVADRCLRHVIKLHPDFVEAQWNLSNLELLLGELREGFKRAEWRFKRPGFSYPARDLPLWKGEPMAGKRLLLVAEQGLGDTIQFIRFAKPLADQNIKVGVEAQVALHLLLATAIGVDEVLKPGEDGSAYDAWLPIMSLPYILGTTLDNIPADMPYLMGPENIDSIALPRKKPLIGFVWQGNPMHDNNRYRSIGLQAWGPVLATRGVQFVSLQFGVAGPDFIQFETEEAVIDVGTHLSDFARTAAVVQKLDLVITVDTAVAHLAGALGKPVWLLVSPANDWRWLTDRDDTPWYPSMRIFRSSVLKVWDDVMTEVAVALSKRVSTDSVKPAFRTN
ncbi:MAG: tetratricopeptide repeat protein [Rhodospirillaceae bacterium]